MAASLGLSDELQLISEKTSQSSTEGFLYDAQQPKGPGEAAQQPKEPGEAAQQPKELGKEHITKGKEDLHLFPHKSTYMGLGILINNLPEQMFEEDIEILKSKIQGDLNFALIHLNGLNTNTVKKVLKCLPAVNCACLIVVILTGGTSNGVRETRSRSLAYADIAEAMSYKSNEVLSKEIPTLLVCTTECYHKADQPLPASKKLYFEFTFANFDISLNGVKSLFNAFNGQRSIHEISEFLKDEGFVHMYTGPDPKETERVVLPFTEPIQEEGTFSPEQSFTELRMTCRLWEEIRNATIAEVERQKEVVQKKIEHLRIMKIIGAMCSFCCELFALLTILFLLFAQDEFNVIMLVVLGLILQLASIGGNLFSASWTYKRRKIIKASLDKIQEVGKVDTALWTIVDKLMIDYKLYIEAKYKPLVSRTAIADVAIKSVTSLSVAGVVVALYPLRIATSIRAAFPLRIATSVSGAGRLINVTLRPIAALTFVLNIIIALIDVVVLTVDMIEIYVYMRKSFPKQKRSKITKLFVNAGNELNTDSKRVRGRLDALLAEETKLVNERDQENKKPSYNEHMTLPEENLDQL